MNCFQTSYYDSFLINEGGGNVGADECSQWLKFPVTLSLTQGPERVTTILQTAVPCKSVTRAIDCLLQSAVQNRGLHLKSCRIHYTKTIDRT
jgi:hypothetical protein